MAMWVDSVEQTIIYKNTRTQGMLAISNDQLREGFVANNSRCKTTTGNEFSAIKEAKRMDIE